MKISFYRKYNFIIVVASFIFLQFFLSHYFSEEKWNATAFILTPIAVLSLIAIFDLFNRARFSNIEKGKEEYASWVLKQMRLPLDEALDDMVNNKAHMDNSGKHIQPYYRKLKTLSETMSKNIVD